MVARGLSAKNGDTLIQTLAATVRVAPGGTRAANVNLIVPAIGSLTGSGTISAKGDLDFAMRAKPTGSGVVGEVSRIVSLAQPAEGIPFHVTGTMVNPVFVPDVGRAVGGLVTSPDAMKKAAGALGGLFGAKQR